MIARANLEAKTDQELLADTRAGRAESFEVVYRRHHAVVLAFLARRAGHPELAPAQFEALKARVLDERDYSEIAEDLRCSESVVRKRVSRALGVLRRSLEANSNA